MLWNSSENRDYPLLRWRSNLGLSQKEAATIIGISQSSISMLERKEVLNEREYVYMYPLFLAFLERNKGDENNEQSEIL